MTHEAFRKLPFLLMQHQVLEVTGYHKVTLVKLIDCNHLLEVRPPGLTERRYRKVQVAMLAGLDWKEQAEAFRNEPLLMKEKAVIGWTGFAETTLDRIVKAHGLVRVRPAGLGGAKFRKVEIARLLGLEKYV